MAKGVQIPIEVIDKFSKQMEDMDRKLGDIGKSAQKQQSTFNLLAADIIVKYGREAAGAIVKFGLDSIHSFAESEKAIASLNIALKNQGFMTEAYSKALQDNATALQSVTTHSDEAILGTQALLTTFGLAGEKLKTTTKAALDLSAGLGIDLRSATMLLGKAWEGETGSLGRYGIKIDETLTGAAAFEAVLGKVNSRFGGAAAAEADTYAGRMAILTNRFDDLKEKIGKELLPVAEKFSEWASKAIDVIEKLTGQKDKLTNSTDKLIVAKRNEIQAIMDERAASVQDRDRFAILTADLAKAAKAYENLTRAKLASATPAAEKAPESKNASEEAALKGKIEAERNLENAGWDILAEDKRAALDKEKILENAHSDEIWEAELRRADGEKARNKERIANFSSTMGTISALSYSKNKEMALIGKTASIAQASMDTYKAANVALASAPPPFNYALAALVVAAGLSNVAKISGVPLAEGALVQSRSGGTLARVGEGEFDEAVIPLDDPRTQRRLAGAFGGGQGARPIQITFGDIKVTIQGSIESGNVQSLARQLAEEVKFQTADNVALAIRLSNIASLNAGKAA